MPRHSCVSRKARSGIPACQLREIVASFCRQWPSSISSTKLMPLGCGAAVSASPHEVPSTPAYLEEGVSMPIKPTPPSPARDKVRAIVPKLIDLTEKVVYGDVWERPGLSK